jgi:hypothetical protein
MKKQRVLHHLVWLSLLVAANALAQGRGGSHAVRGHTITVGFSGGHYAYVGGFRSSFYWGGFGGGFSFGWPYYAYPAYPYYRYYPYPYYSYYGYPYWWVPSGPYVWGAPPPAPPARGVPSQPPGSNSLPPAEGVPPQPPASNSPPSANADGQWHKFGGSGDTPSPQGNTVLASVRTNNLASAPRSRRPDGEWHTFGEDK